MFDVLYKDNTGRSFVLEQLNAAQKDNFVNTLKNAGITYEVIQREEKKTHVVSVVFDLNNTTLYTFADKKNVANIGDIVEVECTDGRRKNALVKAAGFRTREEIATFCAKIGYKKLGDTIKVVWSTRKESLQK